MKKNIKNIYETFFTELIILFCVIIFLILPYVLGGLGSFLITGQNDYPLSSSRWLDGYIYLLLIGLIALCSYLVISIISYEIKKITKFIYLKRNIGKILTQIEENTNENYEDFISDIIKNFHVKNNLGFKNLIICNYLDEVISKINDIFADYCLFVFDGDAYYYQKSKRDEETVDVYKFDTHNVKWIIYSSN